MTHILFLVGMLTFGTGVDPIAGSTLSDDERDASPSGRHLGSLADLYFVEWVNLQNAGGGLARFDPLYLSSHGHAWNQLQTTLWGLDISDGVEPGFMVNIPFHAWESMRYRPIWSARPELSLAIPLQDLGNASRFELRGGRPIGGPLFLPPGMMDREPATLQGVNSVRRELRQALEINGQYRIDGENWDGLFAVDYAEHLHRYPTLISPRDGAQIGEHARSLQVLTGVSGSVLGQDLESMVAMEWMQRSHDGAQFRLPEWLTHRKDTLGILATLKAPWEMSSGSKWVWALAAGYKDTDRTSKGDGAIVSDIESQWLWQGRPTTADDVKQLKVSSRVDAEFGTLESLPKWVGELNFSLLGSHTGIRTDSMLPETLLADTYRRSQSYFGEPVGVSITQYEGPSQIDEAILHGRLQTEVRLEWGDIWLDATAALDAVRGANQSRMLIGHIGEAGGLALHWQATEDTRVWALVRREPLSMAHSALSFANDLRPSGVRSVWNDNGDGVPRLEEAGAVLSVTGGAYHEVDASLRRPMDHSFAMGTEIKRVGPFDFSFAGTAHWLLNRYTVRYAEDGEPQYTQTSVEDPGGDGLGETKVEGGGQLLTAYNRVPGSEGEERYMLTNASRADLYLGLALEF
ncbi:MAG: hypothetical protein HOK97_23880, partial [Deltaproteobacteria bacterium]|nr:hypothetical protein [Deltaproteobacteria bacterium]